MSAKEEKRLTDAQDYIRQEISKTGYPLELEVYSFLSKSNVWIVTAQDYYYDEDEKKGRSVDITAMDMPHIDENGHIINSLDPINMNWDLSIECKYSSNENWIFFPVEDFYIDTSGQSLNLRFLQGPGFGHYDPSKEQIASTYTVLPEKKNEIFEAVMQIMKSITYNRKTMMSRVQNQGRTKYVMHFWFPIIVFDGKMWKVSVEEGRIIDVIETKHVILKSRYKPTFSDEVGFAIDVVHRSAFGELMKVIQDDINSYSEYLLKYKPKARRYLKRLSYLEKK